MSWQAMEWVLKHSRSKGASRLVALGIAYHIDKDGKPYSVSAETIAGYANIKRASVFPCLDDLKELGELECVSGGGFKKTNLYTLKLFVSQASLFGDGNSQQNGLKGPAHTVSSARRNSQNDASKQSELPDTNRLEPALEPERPASTIATAFRAFDFAEPFGHPAFQAFVIQRAPERHNGNKPDVMERVSQDCQSAGVKIPHEWHDAKHAAQKYEPADASERSERKSEASLEERTRAFCAKNATNLKLVSKELPPKAARRVKEIAKVLAKPEIRDINRFEWEVTGPFDREIDRLVKENFGPDAKPSQFGFPHLSLYYMPA